MTRITVHDLRKALAIYDGNLEVAVECETAGSSAAHLLRPGGLRVQTVERDGLKSAALIINIDRNYVSVTQPEDDPDVAHEAPENGGY